MHRSTLTSKGQTTIPRAVRDALGVSPGDGLVFEERGGAMFLRKAATTASLAGLMDGKLKRPLVSIAEEKEAAAAGWLEGALQGMADPAASGQQAG